MDSGATGAMEAMMCMGAGYFSIMMLAALTLKRPALGYKPEGFVPPPPVGGKGECRRRGGEGRGGEGVGNGRWGG